MIENHLLENYKQIKDLSWNNKIEFLYAQQLKSWPMALKHYQHFTRVKKRSIKFNNFQIDIQYNPARVRSTCADTRKKAIEKRPCFLCSENLPLEQKGFKIIDKYLLLINPFPIFEKHLTISDFRHTPQHIKNRIIDMLAIAKALSYFTVFYNGAKCGASAPDHFHFQAAQKGTMPFDKEINSLTKQQENLLFKNDEISIAQINHYLRTTLIFESENPELINNYFLKAISQLQNKEEKDEANMNIIANYEDNKYRLTLFPRSAQRPSCYFKEGAEKILVSPASVELGGLVITPREEDYHKIKDANIIEIFSEVSQVFNFVF